MALVSQHIAEQANAIAGQAEAIRDGRTSASPLAAAKLLVSNAATLLAWLEQEAAQTDR
jgi:hypothetical protein